MKQRRLNLSRKWLIFTVTATGTFMGTLDGGVVNIALPSMAGEFNAGIESIQSVVSVYLLAVTCFLPVFGKLSDMFSRKKLYLGGFLLFGIGSLFCSVAGSLPLMIAARAVQARRYAAPGYEGVRCNAQLTAGQVRRVCRMTPAAERLLRASYDALGLSARAHDRILRVARTVADLAGKQLLDEDCVLEALQYRAQEKVEV